jgi:hypothetical protein
MGKLAEYLRTEVDQIRAEMSRRKELLDEWLGAINRLYEQLDRWLTEADNGLGLLSTNHHTTTELIGEPRLGHYKVNVMWVVLGGAIGDRKALIVPRARFVAAVIQPPGREPRRADGMVQIKELSSPEYYLFRWKNEDGDEWFIQSVSTWNANPSDNRVEPLDRDRFEAAILQVLQ